VQEEHSAIEKAACVPSQVLLDRSQRHPDRVQRLEKRARLERKSFCRCQIDHGPQDWSSFLANSIHAARQAFLGPRSPYDNLRPLSDPNPRLCCRSG